MEGPKEGRAEWVIVVRRLEMDDAAVQRVDRVLKQQADTYKSYSIDWDQNMSCYFSCKISEESPCDRAGEERQSRLIGTAAGGE